MGKTLYRDFSKWSCMNSLTNHAPTEALLFQPSTTRRQQTASFTQPCSLLTRTNAKSRIPERTKSLGKYLMDRMGTSNWILIRTSIYVDGEHTDCGIRAEDESPFPAAVWSCFSSWLQCAEKVAQSLPNETTSESILQLQHPGVFLFLAVHSSISHMVGNSFARRPQA